MSADGTERLRVGLVGAGPWGQLFTGPMLARSTDADFVGIWARRPQAAAELARVHGVTAYDDLDALFADCDAVTFSVPPSVQAALAARAARAGLAVLLDKPVGANVAEAEALAGAIDEARVVSQVILTNRYFDSMRSFLDDVRGFDSYGGRASFFGDGAVPGTYFATPWRVAEGGLLDLGPHVLDGLDAALGRIVAIEAHGDPLRLVLLECEHENGRVSQAALSANSNQTSGLMVEVYGRDFRRTFDVGAFTAEQTAAEFAGAQRRIVAEFAAAVASGTPHELDVHRGLHLQRLIDGAAAQLSTVSSR
jgi:predicted dehydrogenase